MEFGIYLSGYIPGPGAHDPEWEHQQQMREAEWVACGNDCIAFPQEVHRRFTTRAQAATSCGSVGYGRRDDVVEMRGIP